MTTLSFSDSVIVDATTDDLYALVSDVTRTGEWSPICAACWWDEGHGPTPGSWFTGRNETPDRIWETRSEVVVAEPGQEFAWKVGGKYARWGYTVEPADGGTRLTESWTFLPEGIDFFHEKYGDQATAQIQDRIDAAQSRHPRDAHPHQGDRRGALTLARDQLATRLASVAAMPDAI